MINQDRKYSIWLFIISFVLAVAATIIGTTFYPHEDGGPARLIGLAAFICLIFSLIFRQRAKQTENNQLVTPMKNYASRLLVVVILLPLYLFFSYWALIIAGFGGNPLPLLFVALGFIGLLYIIFRK
jgi:hypothetical protein